MRNKVNSQLTRSPHWGAVLIGVAMSTAAPAGEHAHHHGMHHHPGGVDHSMHALPAQGALTRTTARYKVPAVVLKGSGGEAIDLRAALGDGPVMVNFIFTSCTTICPPMTATFAAVQQRLSAETASLRMVSISIDPEYDTPARLEDYAERFGAKPGWQFLTGSVEDSVAVQRAFGVYRGSKMNHAPVTLLRAGADAPWVRIEGFASATDLLQEVRRLTPGKVAMGR